jgi:MoxR-like ATPase
VTVDGQRHPLPDPFFVIATQNPVEQHGTFPLPEGQLDRFTMCLQLGSISLADELQVLREQVRRPTVEQLRPALDASTLTWLRAQAREVFTSEAVQRYLLSLVIGTRDDPAVAVGASTRSAIALNRAAQAWAMLVGRDFVTPDDVKHLAVPVLAHRLSLAAGPSPRAAAAVVARVVATVPVPVP